MRVLVAPLPFADFELERLILEPLGAQIDLAASMEEVVDRAPAADVLLLDMTPVGSEVISRLGRCRGIVRYGVGVDGIIDVDAATERGIPVGNVPHGAREIAEYTVGLSLMLLRRIPEAAALVAAGGWGYEAVSGVRPVFEQTALLVGWRPVGIEVAPRLAALGMRVVVHDADGGTEDCPYPVGKLEELLPNADLVCVHPLPTNRTVGLLSRERLALLRPTSAIVTMSRGGVIDEHEVAAMLREGRLFGAAVDAFEREPLPPDHPLRTAPHAVLTSHVSWRTERSEPLLRTAAAGQVARVLRGERLDPVVNPNVY
jgi:D-3-phosphoglycerate dehydrogenase